MTAPNFVIAGKTKKQIEVRISYRIIELFSEGLYSSPHKAIEELVCNGFDAGAKAVHIILPTELAAPDSAILVVDDGMGMDVASFEQHWLIGSSDKRLATYTAPRGRRQIGKFGIGKLATFVLGNRLSHVSKKGGKYYAVSMDYSKVPAGEKGTVHAKEKVPLNVRELTEAEARTALEPWLDTLGDTPKLFGKSAKPNWTIAIMSELKDMATEIKPGVLRWVLSTAMPLRDDFHLYVDGAEIKAKKLLGKKLGKWVLGKDLVELPKPAPDDIEERNDAKLDKKDPLHHGLFVKGLGRVTGYVELFEDPLDTGKSGEIERSNGFFVYVYGRLVNVSDAGFGIDRNVLRHGTFSRFRGVIHVDGLDPELRASRENIRSGPRVNTAKELLHGIFNFVRAKHDAGATPEDPSKRVGARIGSSPAALTRRPVATLVSAAFKGKYKPRTIHLPDAASDHDRDALIETIRGSEDTTESLIDQTVVVTTLRQADPIAILDVATRTLQINGLHPFVAYFLGDFEDIKHSLPLQLLATSEVLLEAHMVQSGIKETVIHDLLESRDLLLRHLARSTGKRNARLIAQALMDAGSSQNELETELVAAFDSMGFAAVPLGKSGRADGVAEAVLGAANDGIASTYKVSLEAKSKEEIGGTVSAKTVGVSTIVRHRDALAATHAVVVAPQFPTTKGEASALAQETANDRRLNEKDGKTITLIKINDLARLVRLVPARRISLNRLRELFKTCSLPAEAAKWIDALEKEKPTRVPYEKLLKTIYDEQKQYADQVVDLGLIRGVMRDKHHTNMTNDEIETALKALSQLVPDWIFVQSGRVELRTRPDKILDAVHHELGEYPKSESAGAV